jgi:hypothetical protein
MLTAPTEFNPSFLANGISRLTPRKEKEIVLKGDECRTRII